MMFFARRKGGRCAPSPPARDLLELLERPLPRASVDGLATVPRERVDAPSRGAGPEPPISFYLWFKIDSQRGGLDVPGPPE